MRAGGRGSEVGRWGGAVALGLLLFMSAARVSAQLPPASIRAAMLYSDAGAFSVRDEPSVVRAFGTGDVVVRALPDTALVDPWLGRDKVLHAAGSFLLTLSAQYVLTSKLDADEDAAVPIAAGATLSLGLAKEVADSRRPVRPLFSTRDLVADAVGVALAVGLILL